MIYTLTCNPSLDYRMRVEGLRPEKTNRSTYEQITAGGKGINVSLMLRNLGYESTVLGFISGFTGEEIARQVSAAGIPTALVRLPDGLSRINVKLQNDLGKHMLQETEINAKGPVIDDGSLGMLMSRLDRIQEGDLLVLSGSIPECLPDTFYRDIQAQLAERKVCVIVDATGELLVKSLAYRPFLIKPNRDELEQLFGVRIRSRTDAVSYAGELRKKGARNVLVSFGGDGALLVSEEQDIYEADAPQGILRNAVGSGDSMVAGFLAGYLESGDYREAFSMGLAAGSASAFSDGFATRDEVLNLMAQIKETLSEKKVNKEENQ
ncbi:MAG: 1-phosphofructokinase [Lachnospiraceae bacterium]|nr:1-phosphofructokinase [Lachnospiraceae bacterium]